MVKYKKLYTACLFLNMFLLPLSTFGMLASITSYFWNETKGVVVSTNRVKVRLGNGYIEEAMIEFTYSVDNVEYVSDIVSLDPTIRSKNRTFALDYLKQYWTGKEVRVFFPSFGTLERGVTLSTFFWFFIALVLLFSGRAFKRKTVTPNELT
ncbi:hypothetical protein ACYTPF_06730 [Alteromonas sp. HB246098]